MILVASGLGLGAFWRRRRRRRDQEELPYETGPGSDSNPAAELRAKLAESKAAAAAEPDSIEDEVEPEPASDPQARRQGVHESARAAIEELK